MDERGFVQQWINNLDSLTHEEALWLGLRLAQESHVSKQYHFIQAWGLSKDGGTPIHDIKKFVTLELQETGNSLDDDSKTAREKLLSLARCGLTIASLKQELHTLHDLLKNALLPAPLGLPTLTADVDSSHTKGSYLAYHLLQGYDLGLASQDHPDLNAFNLVYDNHFSKEWKDIIEITLQDLPYSKTIFLIIYLLKNGRFQAVDAFNMLTAATVLSGKNAGFTLNVTDLKGLAQDPDHTKSAAQKLREVHLLAAGFDPKTSTCSCGAKAEHLVPLADHLKYGQGGKCEFRHDLLTKTNLELRQLLVELANQLEFSINQSCWGCGKKIPKASTHQELMVQPAYATVQGHWSCDFCGKGFEAFKAKKNDLARKGVYINPPAPFNCPTCELDYCSDCLSCDHIYEKVDAREAAKRLDTHEINCDLCNIAHIDWSKIPEQEKKFLWNIHIHPQTNMAICKGCRDRQFSTQQSPELKRVSIEKQLEVQPQIVCDYTSCMHGAIPGTRKAMYTAAKYLYQCKTCLTMALCERCYSNFPAAQLVEQRLQ